MFGRVLSAMLARVVLTFITKTMTDSQRNKCHAFIYSAAVSAAAVGAGLAQLPGSDNVVLVPIEVGMVMALGKVFDIHITESGAKVAVAGRVGTTLGRTISQFLIGWIPGPGNVWNASTACGVVEGLGWTGANDFAGR